MYVISLKHASGIFVLEETMSVKALGKRRRFSIKPYLFVLPALFFALVFVYYPFLKTFASGFSLVNAQGKILSYVGLYNFRYLFSRREFAYALKNTLLLTLVNVPVTVVLTLTMALLACKKRLLSPLCEGLFALPMAVSMATAALIFKLLFNPTVGIINQLFGLESGWFEDRRTALGTMLILTVWMGLGFNFLLFLSALRSIPDDRISAARVDGAGEIMLLWHIRLPAILPTLVYVCASNAVLALMTSGPVMIITKGGPARATTTLIYMMYTSGYASSNDSLAACVSIVCFLLAFLFTGVLLFLERGKVGDV